MLISSEKFQSCNRISILMGRRFSPWPSQDISLVRDFYKHKRSRTTRERKEKETLQALLGPTSPFHTFRRTDCTVSKSEYVSRRLHNCSQKNGTALFHDKGFHQSRMGISLVIGTNRYIRDLRIPVTHISNQFRWGGGARVGILKNED